MAARPLRVHCHPKSVPQNGFTPPVVGSSFRASSPTHGALPAGATTHAGAISASPRYRICTQMHKHALLDRMGFRLFPAQIPHGPEANPPSNTSNDRCARSAALPTVLGRPLPGTVLPEHPSQLGIRAQLVRNVAMAMDPKLAAVHSSEVPLRCAKRAGGCPREVVRGRGRQENPTETRQFDYARHDACNATC